MNGDKQKTILLVEDEAILAFSGKMNLERYGYIVFTVDTGEEAIEFFKENDSIDLILMDIDLGTGMDGTQTAELILKDYDVPIVFQSNHVEPEVVEKTEKITAYGYVVKDSSITVLDASIKMAFKLFEANRKIVHSEEKYKNLFNNAEVAIFRTTIDGSVLIDINEKMASIVGLKREDLLGQLNLNYWADPKEREELFKILKSEGRVVDYEWKLLTRNGEIRNCITSLKLYEKEGYLEGTFQDITDRKKTEDTIRRNNAELATAYEEMQAANEELEATSIALMSSNADLEKRDAELQKSEESLYITLQSIGDAVIATDLEERITKMNKTAEILTGWTFLEAENQPLSKIFTILNGSTRLPMDNPVKKVLETGEIIELANHAVLIGKDGREFQISDSAAPIRDKDGKIRGVVLVFSDVTEKYKVEKELLRTKEEALEIEKRYRLLFNNMPEGFALHELIFDENGKAIDYRFLDLNPAFEKLTGLKREVIIGKGQLEVMPSEDPFWFNTYSKVALTGEPIHIEHYSPALQRNYEVYAYSPVKNQFAVIFMDITKRVKALEELKESEERLELVLKGSNLGFWDWNILTGEVHRNKRWAEMLGYTIEEIELTVKQWTDLIHPDDRDKALLSLNNHLNGIAPSHQVEYRMRTKDQKWKWIFDSANVVKRDSDGKPIRMSGTHRDITKHKKQEQTLRETNEYLENLLDYANAPIIVWNTNLEITRFNHAFEQLSGYLESEVISKQISFLFPEDKKEYSLDLIEMTSIGENWETVEIEILRKDGIKKTVLWNSANIFDNKKEFIVATIAQGQDITERKLEEDKVKSLLNEKEMILKEVHHRIKNNMSIIRALLSIQAETLKEPIAISALHDAENRVQSMMILYDKLYRTSDFRTITANSYIPFLIDGIIGNFPNQNIVKVEKKIDDFILNAEKMQPLGILINELLTNIMKYAFVGRESGLIYIEVSLKSTETSSVKKVQVIIQDNGIGMPASINFENSEGFGLMLIQLLTKQLQGKIQIIRDNGTKTVLEFTI